MERPVTDPLIIKVAFQMVKTMETKFKHMYYSMKAKGRLLAWMWRARESLAMKKYHPDELFKRLEHGFDALERW
jgi:hypothetical protein